MSKGFSFLWAFYVDVVIDVRFLQCMFLTVTGARDVILDGSPALLLLLLYNIYVSCHRHFFLVLLLNQR